MKPHLEGFEHGAKLLVAERDALLLRGVEERNLLELALEVAEEGDFELRLGCKTSKRWSVHSGGSSTVPSVPVVQMSRCEAAWCAACVTALMRFLRFL